jgi:hypothetical protein
MTEPRRSLSDKGPAADFKVKSPPEKSFFNGSELLWAADLETNTDVKNKTAKTR